MASSSSSTMPSCERTSHFISQTKMEMESSKARHWSELDYSTTDSEWSAETNFNDFALLKKDPQWSLFFRNFETLEVGEKISGGAQADIYEARMTRNGPFDIYEARNTRDGSFDLVVKVMKGVAPLKTFQAQWPIGMLSARSKYIFLDSVPLIAILGGTVLHDKRLRGRFAFVMFRRWGDLRLLIDRRMKKERSTRGPFPIDEAIHLMLNIARDMESLHDRHDILHRDLKASNVLVWGDFGEDMSLVATSNREARIGSVVADFECSVGVLGTGFWRAPEILKQLKDRVLSSEVLFTRASDVYSYGMTCYEIVTGCIPYDGRGGYDTISQILKGLRPELPQDLPEFVRNIIIGCWHSDLSERPSFSDICMALKLKRSPYPVSVVIDNKSERGASIVKVEQWNIRQAFTLLEVMQRLMDMNLSVLKASDSSSTAMITQYFEVTDCKGRKVVNDKGCFADILKKDITKTLRYPVIYERPWITETSIGGNIDGNTLVQMHVIEVVAEWSAGLFGVLCRLLVAINFRVHSAGCWRSWIREGRLECVIYVEGARMGTLLWELRHNIEYFRKSTGRFKIIVHRVAAEEFSHLSRRLHNLKSMDLTRPRNSSNMRVHQRKEFWEGVRCIEIVVCPGVSLENRWPLISVSRKLADMDYKIFRASIDYPGPYKFLKGRANKSEVIDVGTLGEDESENMIHRILDIAIQRGCPAVNGHLIVSGPSKELPNDLMRSLRENDLVVTGGQVYREFGTGLSFPPKYLDFFVTEKSAAGAGQYSSMSPF